MHLRLCRWAVRRAEREDHKKGERRKTREKHYSAVVVVAGLPSCRDFNLHSKKGSKRVIIQQASQLERARRAFGKQDSPS